jgi:uncharacterized protein (DUF305 family)
VRSRSAAAAALAILALAGCGGDSGREAAPAERPDDAFVVRAYAQQQVALALLRSVRERVRERDVRALIAPMVELRERRLAELEPLRTEVGAPEELADLGVSREQAAEDVTPTALDGVRPLTPAFLATMARHDAGVIALARAEVERGRDPKIQAVAREMVVEYTRELEAINRAIAAFQQAA